MPALSAVNLIVVAALGLSLAMAGAWLVQRATRHSGWIDTIWSLSVGAAGLGLALAPVDGTDRLTSRQIAVALLVAVWSLRLGLSIARRTMAGGEDPRYAQLIQEWGDAAPRRLFWFLQAQALAAMVLALSVFAAARNPAPGLRIADVAGMAVLGVAIAGEALADRQLRRFRANPTMSGGICEVGLWAYSRHPNYFFEWLGWCAYPLVAIDLSPDYPWGWFSLAGPILMYGLLVHVSGIPPLEQHMVRSRGAAFRDYQKRVSAFIPMPRRHGARFGAEGKIS